MLRRMTSLALDEMAQQDGTLERFEELSRHGYSLEKILSRIESDYDFYLDEDSDWDYE